MFSWCKTIRLRGYKIFFMPYSAEHKIFSANKYENANYCWHFHIYQQRKFHAQLYLPRKTLQLLIIWDLLAGQISCSDELSMKKVFYNLGASCHFPKVVYTMPDRTIRQWTRQNINGDTQIGTNKENMKKAPQCAAIRQHTHKKHQKYPIPIEQSVVNNTERLKSILLVLNLHHTFKYC